MPQNKQNFLAGVNLDADELRIPTSENKSFAAYIYNMTWNVQQNPDAAVGAGNNEGVWTPLEGNNVLPLTVPLPAGTNYCVGFYNSEHTNEGYSFIYNSLGNHEVRVIDGDTGNERVVYEGSLLPFVLNPENYVGEGRCTLILRSYIDPVTGSESNFKFLIFTVNTGIQYCISVEDSADTNSYNAVSFPRFAGAPTLYDPLLLIHLGVETPINPLSTGVPPEYPISITEVAPIPSDTQVQNLLLRTGWQFRVKYIDVFGRESVHGIISDMYISVVGGGCIGESNSLPRCLQLQFDGGSPLVDYIQIEYRKTIGNDPSGALWTDWLKYETITKYIHTPGERWYSYPANTAYLNASTNVITYIFCANKGTELIPTVETDMTEPAIPLTSSAVAVVGTQLMLSNNVRGFQPLPQSTIGQIQFSAIPPSLSSCPVPPLVEVIVYAAIWQPYNNYLTGLWMDNHTTPGAVVWGYYNNLGAGLCNGSTPYTMAQVFADQTSPGWVGYLVGQAGAECAVVSEQGYVNNTTGIWTPLPATSVVMAAPAFLVQDGVKCPLMQRWVFKVRAGKYVFRVASHHAKITDSNFKQTSTYVAGRWDFGSVYVTGTTPTDYATGPLQYAKDPIKELVLDCSTGATIYDFRAFSDKVLIILDLTDVGGNACDGYYYENSTGLPIEMNPVYWGTTSPFGAGTAAVFGSFYTDHNGYYFGASTQRTSVYLYTNFCDGLGNSFVFTYQNIHTGAGAVYGTLVHGDGTGGHPSSADPSLFGSGCSNVQGYWYNKVYAVGGASGSAVFPDGARRYIDITIDLCSTSIGAPGIPIIMTKGMYKSTNSNGFVELVAHNRYAYSVPSAVSGLIPFTGGNTIANYDTVPQNQDALIISQRGGCSWYVCGSCTTYAFTPDPVVTYQSCATPPCSPPHCRILILSTLYVNIFGVNIKGVQTGGTYPVGFWLFNKIGQHTFVQAQQSGAAGTGGTVTIPNLNDPAYQSFQLYKIGVTVSSTFAAPGFSKIAFGIAPNTAFSDYATWAADWIQYIDDTGQDNAIEPTSIRVYYQSMNEYAKNYNFTTNNVWQFQSTGTTTNGGQATPNVGDIIQFIMNGDGTWINNVVSSSIVFNDQGTFFTIDFLPELSGLQNGCLFRVIRPITQQNINTYYEQCLVLDLDANGRIPSSLWGVLIPLNYYDSYMLQRTIPVPVMGALINTTTGGVTTQTVGSQPYEIIFPGNLPSLPLAYTDSGTGTIGTTTYSTNNPNLNHVIIMTSQDLLTYFPFLFESPSPSDFWGSHISNRGRAFFTNPYEAQQRVGTEIALSDKINQRGLLNNMAYFESINVFTFDYNTWGNIVSVLIEVSQALFICEKNNFTSYYGTTQLRADANGYVAASNILGIFQQPNPKVGEDYGCSPYDINTIRRYKGIARWLSSTGVIAKSDFTNTVAEYNTGYIGWLKQAVSQVKQLNNLPLVNGVTYWVAGIDPKTFEYYLTVFNQKQNLYINQAASPQPILTTINQTVIIDLATGALKGYAPFTPEYYGLIPAYYEQTQFLSFNAAQPYLHHNTNIIVPYGYFYSVQCPCYIIMIVNEGAEKPKRFFACELYVRQTIATGSSTPNTVLFFVPTGGINTEQGQISEIPPFITATSTTWQQFWRITDGFQAAAFLCDANTPTDPNLPIIANIIDGNPLQGRWMRATFKTNTNWDGSYFELSAINTYFDFIEKSSGNS